MPRDTLPALRDRIDAARLMDQNTAIDHLTTLADLSSDDRLTICKTAADMVTQIRGNASPELMEVFLAEYGLSTIEGIALMCLAEALLRVPDAETIDALIEDKIAPSDWGKHLGQSASSMVNASTWALLLTGKVLDDEKPGIAGLLRGALKRVGEPVIRAAVGRAMREMGKQFVLGTDIRGAMDRAAKQEARGYTYSYDMLGEAAATDADARGYHIAYSRAISAIAEACTHDRIADNPGISVKLSALHPRYEVAQANRVMTELVPRIRSLALLAKSAGMGLNIDAEEADRLSLSLDVIETVLAEPALAGWDGFGVVVQAYGPRASYVIDWLYQTAQRLDRKIMVRLVKGAYWDTEVKLAQVEGLAGFPVFTSKAATDISYIANARKLLGMTDRIYPQFATHNAHTVAAILHMADETTPFEFQRLHGMGETLHDIVLSNKGTKCRIYAPVGAHRDLLAYLVRRLLENGANSSFVNQIVDEAVPPLIVAADPFEVVHQTPLATGPALFSPERRNSVGWDLTDQPTLDKIDSAMLEARAINHTAGDPSSDLGQHVENPTHPNVPVGTVNATSPQMIDSALSGLRKWDASPQERARVLNAVADQFEADYGVLFDLLTHEAGKTRADCVGELREAVDFLRYYAARGAESTAPPLGLITCISPWNFPLAIFTGQISAALAAGNGVIAKSAEQTPLIAARAVMLMHQAGVPKTSLCLMSGDGGVGSALTQDPRINGVVFTGSTATAQKIHSTMAKNLAPGTPFIAETGGLNAMICDSTALPEHATRDIIQSAFQSAGQRCSALRCLYVQEDIADTLITMIKGAMQELRVGDPALLSTDVGPVIDQTASDSVRAYIETARAEDRVLAEQDTPGTGHFIAPTLIKVDGIQDLTHEVFGPVLHIATFKSGELDDVIADINATGYGLTFGLHTRIDDRVQHVSDKIKAGNIYVNRNQIGAVVGSQPFGGEGLSGTGPKAGGPLYLTRFLQRPVAQTSGRWSDSMSEQQAQDAIDAAPLSDHQTITDLPGPTGESNRLKETARAPFLCLGPGSNASLDQARAVQELGGRAVVATGALPPKALETLTGFSGVLFWGSPKISRDYACALANRSGAILPLVTTTPDASYVIAEHHICIDTTASGGNADLLAQISPPNTADT